MTRVLHTADTHIGYRQYHSPERRADFLEAFRAVIDDAVDAGVDAVVHAGDLFHDRTPGLSDLLGTVEVLETLAAASIPFLAVVGNHESKRSAQWLDLFETMGLATRLGPEPFVVGDTAFYGLDFVPPTRREGLEYDFAGHDADHAALVSHGRFDPLVPEFGGDLWDVEAILSASPVEFDAVLLGDEHEPKTAEVGGTWVTYPGSTERASASERDDRGYNVVEFDGDVRISTRGIETRPFVFVDLELGESEGIERVRGRLAEHDLEGAVVHVTLEGAGEAVPPARIEEYAADEGALVARVKDRRELTDAADAPDVSFADPDAAVEERLRELELSDAARDLDETVRSGTIADSNVADEVERRVDELVSDPEAFGSTAEPDADADGGPADSGDDRSEVDDRSDGNSAVATDRAEPSDAGEDQSSMEEYL